MPDAVMHPTHQDLIAFGLGKLSEREAAAVAAHLESCPACRQAVADVVPDSFLAKVRDAGKDGALLPPSLTGPAHAPSNVGWPTIPNVICPDVPPELARHPKYLILRELGRGGMGVVYQARHKEMGRQIVIKILNRALLDRPGTLERFHREVQAAALLSHPNIVTAYDAEQVGNLHLLVMEFVPGQSLAEVVDKKGPLPVVYACLFARQVALGLQHAHERGLVHRDIKPQNLMLSLKNQIKILDFGLAKVLREETTSAGTGLTSHNACMGTPDYCAPEQATDARTADIRADLYSLGCTLYYLLSGRPPFRERTALDTILAHLQKQPQPLPELRPDVPAELWQVVKRLLAKEPAQRFQQPKEVAQALLPFIRSGAKQEAKGGSTLPPSVWSPDKGTVIAADTGEIKKILQEVPRKTPPKEEPAKDEAAPFADLVDTPALPKKVKAARGSPKRPPTMGYRRWLVVAGVGSAVVALGLLTVYRILTDNRQPVPAEGTIRLRLPDFADAATIRLDGQPWDADKLAQPLRLSPGEHLLKVSSIGFQPLKLPFTIKPGENPPLDVRMTRPLPGLVAELYRGQFDILADAQVHPSVEITEDRPLPTDFQAVWWRGFLSAPRAGKYRLSFWVDDAVTLWVDEQLVLDEWKWRHAENSGEMEVELSPQPVLIEVKYYNIHGKSALQLKWAPPGEEEAVPVPSEFFWHDPLSLEQARRAARPADKLDEPRIVAEWALKLGGTVRIKSAEGEKREIRTTTVLPAGPFTLEAINLSRNVKVTDTELKMLFRWMPLKRLVLADTQVGDAGLFYCDRLQGLEELDLRGTKTTAEGVEGLQAKLPRCKIESPR